MFYIKRNAEGELLRVQPEPFEGMNGELHADSEEARSWFSNQNVESSPVSYTHLTLPTKA